MKIQSSSVGMVSQRSYSLEVRRQENLIIERSSPGEKTEKVAPKSQPVLDSTDTLKAKILEILIEKLFGKPIHFLSIDPSFSPEDQAFFEKLEALVQQEQKESPPEVRFRYQMQESYHEKESTVFAAQGTVKTQDGKEIDFSVRLGMSREFTYEHHLVAGNLTDPLVVNFAGNAAELSETKFRFDLDADGEEDQISFLKPGSGFLALDRNEDGKINDGNELFGPKSGDGFQELARYDQDQNGWIDEGDDIYRKLRIWSKDAQGKDQLLALGEAGVGALYLGHLSTAFTQQGENGTLGQVRDTGVFLKENGEAGTLQQIDLSL